MRALAAALRAWPRERDIIAPAIMKAGTARRATPAGEKKAPNVASGTSPAAMAVVNSTAKAASPAPIPYGPMNVLAMFAAACGANQYVPARTFVSWIAGIPAFVSVVAVAGSIPAGSVVGIPGAPGPPDGGGPGGLASGMPGGPPGGGVGAPGSPGGPPGGGVGAPGGPPGGGVGG